MKQCALPWMGRNLIVNIGIPHKLIHSLSKPIQNSITWAFASSHIGEKGPDLPSYFGGESDVQWCFYNTGHKATKDSVLRGSKVHVPSHCFSLLTFSLVKISRPRSREEEHRQNLVCPWVVETELKMQRPEQLFVKQCQRGETNTNKNSEIAKDLTWIFSLASTQHMLWEPTG